MKKLDSGQIVALLTNLGVIAGIIFLAVEIGQNNELMVDEAERARAESRRQSWVLLVENAEVADLMVRELDGEQLTAVEEFRLTAYWMRDLVGYQTAFQQLPREDLLAAGVQFRRFFDTRSSFRKTWEEYRDTLDPEFVQWMSENVVNER